MGVIFSDGRTHEARPERSDPERSPDGTCDLTCSVSGRDADIGIGDVEEASSGVIWSLPVVLMLSEDDVFIIGRNKVREDLMGKGDDDRERTLRLAREPFGITMTDIRAP